MRAFLSTLWDRRRSAPSLAVSLALMFTAAGAASAIPAVWTEHNDNNRSGANLSETVLTPSNVNASTFGTLFHYTLDDQSFSQPLYVPGLTMSVDNAVHNVVFVTTVNDSVYAFDADSGTANGGNPLWHVNLAPAGASVPANTNMSALGACGGNYQDFAGKFGIVGTPVIDASTDTLYVVARTIENGAWIQRLHALSCTSGAEKFGGPVVISGSHGGTNFDPVLNNQRPALALANGVVYIGWSSHCDFGAYHGYLMGYNASNLSQVAAWSATTSGTEAGIWQSGQAPSVDGSNNLYFLTGNGTMDGAGNFGESFVKLAGGSLTEQDFFSPSNFANLNQYDTDLGAAGCLLIPGTTDVTGGGKQGMLYLVNQNNLGHENATDQVVQEFQATFPQGGNPGEIHGGPIWFNSGSASYMYLWGDNDFCRAYQWNGSNFNSNAVGVSTMLAPVSGTGDPGGFLSVSANGTSNGIIWALTPYNGDANQSTVAGILHAFNATPSSGVLTELWNSRQNASRDSFGNYAKFTYPTVVNGKVYIATFGNAASGSGGLWVYGEIPATLPAAPTGLTATAGPNQVTLSWNTSTGATSYNVYRGTSAGGESSTPVKTGLASPTYVDTGLTNGTTYYYKVAAVNTAGTSALSGEQSAVPNSTAPLYQIDCGSPSSVSPFVADELFSAGNEFSSGNAINLNGQTNPAPSAVYQTVRWNSSFNYTITGLTAGSSYTVRLHFCELTWTANGQRLFNVAINGASYLSNFDIFAAAGGQNKAVIEQTTATANSSGQIVISFTQGSADNPEIAGIEILGSGGSTAPSTPTLSGSAGNAGVSLSWTSSSGTSPITYSVYRGTSAGGEGSTPIASGLTGSPYTDSTVSNGTSYYYKVTAVNAAGSATSNEVGPLTPQASVPAPPTLNAPTAGNTTVALTWSQPTGATSYNVYRGTPAGAESSTPVKTGLTSASYTDTGLTNGTTYYYKVAAVNTGGTSPLSNEQSSTPAAGEAPYGGTPWPIPGTIQSENYDTGGEGVAYHDAEATNLGGQYRTTEGVDIEATTDTGGGFDVGWNMVGEWQNYTVNVATAGTYTVTFRVADGNSASGSFHLQDASGNNLTGTVTVAPTGGWQTWTNVTANVTLPAGRQILTVWDDGSNYNLNYMTFASQTGTAPSAPTLSATAGNTTVSLVWSASSGTAPINYSVYRGTSAGGEGSTAITTTSSTTFNDSGLTNGTKYYYIVKAANSVGTATSNEVNATPQPTAPAAPTLNSATAGNATVALSWSTSTGATSYNVYQGTSAGGESTTPIASGLTGTTYTASGLTNGTTYYYKVAAVNSAGTSALSNEQSATPAGGSIEAPYGGTPWAIPGTVQSENYDTGGEGVAYHDADAANLGGQYRTSEGVDIENCSDTGGGYDVGWNVAGEWQKYTVNVASAGTYTVTFRVADGTTANGSFHLQDASGANLTGTVTVAPTGGWQTWTNVTANVTLPAGRQILTVWDDGSNYNLNYMSFAAAQSAVDQIDCGSPSAVSPFAADEFFSAGNEFSSGNTINLNGQSSPAPAAVYQTVRWNSSFAYTIPNLTAGATYTVRLHFCELTWTASGQRLFNVAINGNSYLSNFDIFATAGGQNKAVIEQTTATANSSGQIVISFTQGTADNPEVAGIEVLH